MGSGHANTLLWSRRLVPGCAESIKRTSCNHPKDADSGLSDDPTVRENHTELYLQAMKSRYYKLALLMFCTSLQAL